MASAFVPSSSEFACDNLARRVVRNVHKETEAQTVSAFINPFLKPIVMRLATSGRFPRDVLSKQVAILRSKLEQNTSTFAMEANGFRTSKLSSREDFRITFKMPNSSDEEWLGFLANEVVLNRREVTTNMTATDVLIHRHAISRWMQREGKPLEDMYEHLAPAIDLLTALSWPVVTHKRKDSNIAVPLGDGMLFGRVKLFASPSERTVFHIGRGSADQRDEPRQKDFKHSVEIEMMTYVDFSSLTEAREELRQRMVELFEDCPLGIKIIADSTYYTTLAMPQDTGNHMEELVTRAKDNMRALLDSPEWSQFINTGQR